MKIVPWNGLDHYEEVCGQSNTRLRHKRYSTSAWKVVLSGTGRGFSAAGWLQGRDAWPGSGTLLETAVMRCCSEELYRQIIKKKWEAKDRENKKHSSHKQKIILNG